MSQTQQATTQQLLHNAKSIHRQIRLLPYELQHKLNFISSQIQNHSSFLSCSFCNSDKYKIDNGFKRAFKKLNLTEKVILFYRICSYIKKFKDNMTNSIDIDLSILIKGEKQMLDTTVYIKDKHQYKEWTVTRIMISIKTKKINITAKSILLDIRDYLIRSVKNQLKDKCFALECILSNERFKTIKFSNQGCSYEQLYKFFKKVQKQALKQQLKSLITPNRASTTSQQHVDFKLTKLSSNQQTANNISPLIINSQSNKIHRSSIPIKQRMMTLKLISPDYSLTLPKIIQKQMLQRQRVSRIKDQSYNEIYKELLPQGLLENMQSYKNFQKVKQTGQYMLYYNVKQSRIKKKYRFKYNQIVIFDWLVDQLNNFSNFHKWKPKMQQIKCLKIFPSQRSKLFHQTFLHQSSKYNYLFIRHNFSLPTTLSSKSSQCYNNRTYYFYDQSLPFLISKNYFNIPEPMGNISYIIWKFMQINDVIQLTIQAKCNYVQSNNKNDNKRNCIFMESYIGQFEKIKNTLCQNNNNDQDSEIHINTMLFENQYIEEINQIQDIDNDTEYFTISESISNGQIKKGLNTSKYQPPSTRETVITKIKSLVSMKFLQLDQKNKENYLKFKHPMLPYKKGKPVYKQPRTGIHPQWQSQWKITQKGQLININRQKIQAQNSVLKGVFKNLGRNFLSGKSILSISLPVEVFGDDSNLSRLCYSYGYAPIMLQAAAKQTDPIQRLKKVFGFSISSMVCYLRMDKPFNPILGQTCQIFIDGCPVYGQQISHHPPISAIFMKGRDYTVYGHLQSKVQLSLNSASGINAGEISVSFDQNDIKNKRIRYTGPAGELSGVLYGDRKMCMIKTSYFVDEENYLFCEVHWSKYKGKSQYSKNYYDSFEGIIYKLKSTVNIKTIKSIKKSDIQSEVGLLNGRWTGAIFYNNELIIDTFKTFPYVTTPYEARLQSDVEYRKDLILRRTQPNLVKAQQAKEELEELQRKDRKLRAQYNKGSGH